MTQKKKQLKDLFKSVENDTPSLERNELRLLLDQKTSGTFPMGSLQTSAIKEDRKRGFIIKGVFIMTLITIIITAFLLSQEPSSDIFPSKVSVMKPNTTAEPET